MSFTTRVSVSSPAPSLANHSWFSGRGRICSKVRVRCGSGIERLRVLEPQLMPNQVAVIMDGNRRWATEKGFAVEAGHEAGRKVLREMSRFFGEMGVKVLSAFAFSTENWGRPKGEIEKLMRLFEEEARESMGNSRVGFYNWGHLQASDASTTSTFCDREDHKNPPRSASYCSIELWR